jgi:DNA repair photolyase
MLTYKNPITMRSGHLTCPLPLSLEAYWSCEADCFHCVGRRLNKVWGNEQRIADPKAVEKKLKNALKKKNKSVVSQALHYKKAFFLGRKADPYQPIELEKRITKQLIEILFKLDWPFALCSRYQKNMFPDTDLYVTRKNLIHILVEITPGLEADWELFERKRTTPISDRLKISKKWIELGLNVGVRGEPFIPGYHTFSQFRDTLNLIKSYGIKSYNTYNLHINEHNIKRLHNLGLDIEKIWTLNQDENWKKIQVKLCRIAEKKGIALGCPDFVNVPKSWINHMNTCCGIDVNNAFTFNTHHWRNSIIKGIPSDKILKNTWEGIGTEEDKRNADIIISGKESKDFYTMKNTGLL